MASETLLDSSIPPVSIVNVDTATTPSLKRRASATLDDEDSSSRKRQKDEHVFGKTQAPEDNKYSSVDVIEDLALELKCGCCTELVYNPVLVSPCQHFFCGSCCVLWIKNGGSNCPACRSVSGSVSPFRSLQPIIDVFLRAAPQRARTERERAQADAIYRAGTILRLPIPRESSPEPDFSEDADFMRPCPHCPADNPYGWRCPHPIPDPQTDPERAWTWDDDPPQGHTFCGNCNNLLALEAPITTKCDFCQVSFCGISVPSRCMVSTLMSQEPHEMLDIADLVQTEKVYENFDRIHVEVEILLDYITARNITLPEVYRGIVQQIQSHPDGFRPLLEDELFSNIYDVPSGPEPEINSVRTRICRKCATAVFIWGLKGWWLGERKKAPALEGITDRPDCTEGRSCSKLQDSAHAKKFNHLFDTSVPS